jgi:predicted NAD-dependent protein-ADP-ribosyltransferase YbiA (DUF1768 family)
MFTEFNDKKVFLSNFYLSPIRIEGKFYATVEHFLEADQNNIKILHTAVKAQFEENPKLKKELLLTGTAVLIEGNFWHDNYWGKCNCNNCKNIEGKNHLGKLLMQVREEL